MAKKIDNHILAILAASVCDGPKLKLPADLPRPDYDLVNKVLEANGGKWNRAAKAHVFGEDAADAIEQALATGEFHRVKQDLGQFDTPIDVVRRVHLLADINESMIVLEPNAGIGNLVAPLLVTGARIRANEIDTKRREHMIARFASYGRIQYGDRDFLAVPPPTMPHRQFDRVVMNPPFAKQADIDHVTHALRFLKPGGRLVAVMSAAVMWREDRKTKEFLAHLSQACFGDFMEDVPAGAFASSGTNVKAVILTVDV